MGRRLRVLVVDDDAELLRALSEELELFAEVTAVESVNAALAVVERGRFDAVVTDLRMPERWGDELLAHVAARSPQTVRILLTGDSDPRRTVRELLDQRIVEEVYRKPRAEGLIDGLRRIKLATTPAPPARKKETPARTS